jgi:hypothetical protein
MDAKAIRRAALITLRRAICERYAPGAERQAWLAWLERLQSEHASGAAWTRPHPPVTRRARAPSHARERTRN